MVSRIMDRVVVSPVHVGTFETIQSNLIKSIHSHHEVAWGIKSLLLSWDPTISLESGLLESFNNCRKHPQLVHTH